MSSPKSTSTVLLPLTMQLGALTRVPLKLIVASASVRWLTCQARSITAASAVRRNRRAGRGALTCLIPVISLITLSLLVSQHHGGRAVKIAGGEGCWVLRHRHGVEHGRAAVGERQGTAGDNGDIGSGSDVYAEAGVAGFKEAAVKGGRRAVEGHLQSLLRDSGAGQRVDNLLFIVLAVDLVGDDVVAEEDVDGVVAVDGALGGIDQGTGDVDGGGVAFGNGPCSAGQHADGRRQRQERQGPGGAKSGHHDAVSPSAAAGFTGLPSFSASALNGATVFG